MQGASSSPTGGAEIGELPLPLPAKLLRVLQDGELSPVGGKDVLRVDVRAVAATNRDLRAPHPRPHRCARTPLTSAPGLPEWGGSGKQP